jgi:hypothetical protein
MNPHYTSHEVCRQLKMSKSKMILTQRSSLHVVQEAMGQLGGGVSSLLFTSLGVVSTLQLMISSYFIMFSEHRNETEHLIELKIILEETLKCI